MGRAPAAFPRLSALFCAHRLPPRPRFPLLQGSPLATAPPFATGGDVCSPSSLFPPPALSSLSQRQPGCRDAPSRAGRSAAGADQAPSSSWPETSPLPSAGSASSGPASVPRSLTGWETRDRREKLLSRPRTGPGGGEGGDRGQSRVVGGSVLGRQRMADAGSGRVGRLKNR